MNKKLEEAVEKGKQAAIFEQKRQQKLYDQQLVDANKRRISRRDKIQKDLVDSGLLFDLIQEQTKAGKNYFDFGDIHANGRSQFNCSEAADVLKKIEGLKIIFEDGESQDPNCEAACITYWCSLRIEWQK